MTAVDLIGGEMAGFADREPVGGALLAHLLDRLAPPLLPGTGGRVLVAGPHDDALVDTLARHGSVTRLLRSKPDAEAAAGRGVPVRCGTLAKLDDTERYDLVVALDGLDRLSSVEGPQYDWAESLAVLRRALRPGGTLLLAVENHLGLHRLVEPAAPPADDGWHPAGHLDDSRPGDPDRLTARLHAAGLTVGWLGAAWPLPRHPTLVVTPDALRDGPVGALSAYAGRAFARAYADRPVLRDPRPLAATAVRTGLAVGLAASWLVVAHRFPEPAGSTEHAQPPQPHAGSVDLPPVLVGDGPLTEFVRTGDGPPGSAPADQDRPIAWRRRRVGGPPSELEGAVPAGCLLEDLVLAACARHDLPAVRRLLTGWATWLDTLGSARTAATPDNVVLDGDVHTLLDPGTTAPVPDFAVAALRRLAETLIAGGYAHPWPMATDPEPLTAVLAGAAGLTAGSPLPAAVDGPPAPVSRREHQQQLDALHRRLADAEAQVRWYEREVTERERELGRARKQIALFDGSLGYRAARLGLGAARRVRNQLRRKP